jgi:hypothetical protein
VKFAAVGGAAILLSGGVLAVVFSAPGGRRAVAVSAVVAFAVQLLAYSIARRAMRQPGRPIMTAWVVGMILRFGAIAVCGLVAVRRWNLDPLPALVSLVVFFFVTTLLEPWLLQS